MSINFTLVLMPTQGFVQQKTSFHSVCVLQNWDILPSSKLTGISLLNLPTNKESCSVSSHRGNVYCVHIFYWHRIDTHPIWFPTGDWSQISKFDDLFTTTQIMANQQEIVNETHEEMYYRVMHRCFRKLRLNWWSILISFWKEYAPQSYYVHQNAILLCL